MLSQVSGSATFESCYLAEGVSWEASVRGSEMKSLVPMKDVGGLRTT